MTERRVVGVAVLHQDVVGGNAQLVVTIWANVVSCPWPWVLEPILSTALPDGWTAARRSRTS